MPTAPAGGSTARSAKCSAQLLTLRPASIATELSSSSPLQQVGSGLFAQAACDTIFRGHPMRPPPLLLCFALLLLLPALPPRAAAQAPVPAPPADSYSLTLPASALPPDEVERGSIQFIGTATVLIRYQGLTILTDPNFLHRGERAHLGYGLSTRRLTEPAIEFEALPPVDLVLLSHMHEDHFDLLVQRKLRRDVPIVTTREASERLGQLGFTQRYPLSRWDSLTVRKGEATLRITALPARHGPRGGALLLPPVMGSMLDFAPGTPGPAYRIYISGDTLVYDDIAEIPKRFPDVDLALLHLGGTRLLGMMKVSMDGKDGVRMMRLISPVRAIPIHYDDYDVFKSPLDEFQGAVRAAGLEQKAIYLRGGDRYAFFPVRR
jgi:L-ascorbate metabolism protein UlaG (beta-lactamase superfamily)